MYSASSQAAVALIVIEVFISPSGMPSISAAMSPRWAIGHADLADLAARELVVGVVAGLRRQVEGDRQARLALLRGCAGTARWRPSPWSAPRRCASSTGGRARAAAGRVSPLMIAASIVRSRARASILRAMDPDASRCRAIARAARERARRRLAGDRAQRRPQHLRPRRAHARALHPRRHARARPWRSPT